MRRSRPSPLAAHMPPSAQPMATLQVYADSQGFRPWLNERLYQRFGRSTSNRAISLAAGLAENALYRVLTRGDAPSADFCEKIATLLEMPRDVVLRYAGLQSLVRLAPDGAYSLADGLTDEERRALASAVRRLPELLTDQ